MNTRTVSVVALILYVSLTYVDSARILGIFPFPSISHQFVFRAVTEALAKNGHDLVVLTTDPAYPKGKHPYNVTEIDVHDVSYQIWTETFSKLIAGNSVLLQSLTWGVFYKNVIAPMAVAQIQTPDMQAILNNPEEKFDLVIYEDLHRPSIYWAYRFKTPVIAMSSFLAQSHTLRLLAAPVQPILYQEMSSTQAGNLNVLERTYELLIHLIFTCSFSWSEHIDYEFAKQIFGDDVPSLREMQKQIDLLFISASPFWTGMRPLPPNIVNLNGIHMKPPKDLPAELKTFLDSSKHGVVYMSLGSNVKSSRDLSNETVVTILRVFGDLPYDVLWKWETDELEGKPDNVRIAKWLPQSDLLRHPKIKLFITQGGMQSTEETIAAGVPAVVIPFFGDQMLNAAKYEQLDIGLKLDRKQLTYDILVGAINEAIDNPKYKENIVRLSKLVQDEPLSPEQRAVWWTEYVIRHKGAKHLRSPAADVSLAEYYMLDAVALLTSALGVATAALCLIIRSIFRALLRSCSKTKLKRS